MKKKIYMKTAVMLKQKKQKARASNEKAYSALTLTCSEPKAFRIIYNAKTTKLPSGNASLAWSRLKVDLSLKQEQCSLN